jgi:DNA-binding transcriptional LysR family regulator
MTAPIPDPEIVELRSFVVLAELRHFGRAAQILGVSQPALSKRLNRLEDKVGGSLLVRGYRDITVTEAGRIMFERAKDVLRNAELTIELSRQALRGEAGRLRIGFGIASIAELLPEVLLRFRRSHPGVQVDLLDMASAAQAQALQADQIDLAFLRVPVTAPDVIWTPILHERLVVASGQRSAWVDREGLRSLASDPFVMCSRVVSASYYDHVLALCRQAGFAPRVVTETNDLFSLLQLVRAGIGVALAPSAAASMRVRGVHYRRLRTTDAAWDIALAWKKQPEQPLLAAFVRTARQVYSEMSGR